MAASETKIVPVILSGGSGTRLWPMSVPDRPKQFLPLTGDKSMFVQTVERTTDDNMFSAPIVVGSAKHDALIDAQLAEAGVKPAAIILEPCARNTAPAIALAAFEAGEAPMLVVPSDHVIKDVAAFRAAIDRALPLAEAGWFITFGIEPQGPETGYGYIQIGDALADGVCRVERFIEKPDRARAEAMLAEGQYVWNGGIFLFRGDKYLTALRLYAADMFGAVEAAMDAAQRKGATICPDETLFASSPSDSVDYAVMEKAEKIAVVPVAMGWSDVGSWDSLCDIDARPSENVIAMETSNSLFRSDGIRIHAVGVSDMIVIASGKDILIVPRGRSQEVKKIVDVLKEQPSS